MKCLSVQQPWADLIVRGVKDVENRTWWTRLRGPILIHAGKHYDHGARAWIERRLRPEDRWVLTAAAARTGAIVGSTELVDCVTRSRSPWFAGPFGFVLQGARCLDRAIPYRGKLYFFDVDDAMLERSRPAWPTPTGSLF